VTCLRRRSASSRDRNREGRDEQGKESYPGNVSSIDNIRWGIRPKKTNRLFISQALFLVGSYAEAVTEKEKREGEVIEEEGGWEN